LFAGQYFDSETGLHYNYFRYYDPQTGRYTQSDPLGLYDGANTYGYVQQNPLRYGDLTGQYTQTLGWGIGRAVIAPAINRLVQWATAGSVLTLGGLIYNATHDDPDFSVPASGSSAGTGSPQCPPNDPLCEEQEEPEQCPPVNKAVNTGLPHASSQGVVRQVFPNQNVANQTLRNLSKDITKNGGFPKGSIVDPSNSTRVLVPTGNNGYAVYQVLKNGSARLKTVLIRR